MGLRLGRALLVGLAGWLAAAAAAPASAQTADRFQEANRLVRSGDYPKGIGIYQELASSGQEGASLYWNWAQASAARGEAGAAMWALLRGRALDPGDAALGREIERIRQAANLDPAEIAPEPLSVLARVGRRFRIGLLALLLAGLSVVSHLAARAMPGSRWPVPAAWVSLSLAVVLALVPLGGALARPEAVVVHRGAPLLASASPSAEVLGTLREAEVLPILEQSGDYLRVQDSSGARGWALASEVWPLDRPPRPVS
jgi:hypothetical protein